MTALPKRVLAYLKLPNSTEIKLAKFGECILDSFSRRPDREEIRICCKLEDDKLILFSPDETDSKNSGFEIEHSDSCPAHELNHESRQSLPADIVNRGVNTAVCVILESSDSCVLLTRRAKHMRTFPNVWVPPGGGLDYGETLQETGHRELREETGITLDQSEIVTDAPLCFWESVFPQTLSRGMPNRQHIVLYHHFRVKLDSRQLSQKIVLDPRETDAYLWLTKDFARLAMSAVSGAKKMNKQSLSVFEHGVGLVQKPISILTTDLPKTGSDVERISSGTKFAIEQWLNNTNHNKELF